MRPRPAEHAATTESCSIPCNLCGGVRVETLATKSRSGKPLRTVICSCCGLVWSDPLPYDPRVFYEKEYRLSYKGTFTPKPKHVYRAGRVALLRHAAIRDFLPERAAAVLDVGTGGGEFLYLLRKAGFRARGIETNTGYAEYAAREYGLDIWNGFVQDAVFPDNSFSMITVWHVLEHTEDPLRVLTKLHDFLTPGGCVVVEVPNVEAVCQSPSSTFHEAHIHNFNPVTLTALARKAGLSSVRSSVSPDGGNVLLVAAKNGDGLAGDDAGIDSGNAAKIIRTLKGHTDLKYRFSLVPYRRLAKRLARIVGERRGVRGYAGGRALLDSMFAQVSEGAPRGAC